MRAVPSFGSAILRVVIASFAVMLWLPGSALAQINLLRVTTCGPGALPATACTIPSTGSGNLIVVAWASSWGTAPTTTSVSDNVGNVYTQIPNARSVFSTNSITDIWYARNSKAGANRVTITPNPSGNNGAAVIWEFSGVDTASPLTASAALNDQPASTAPLGAAVSTSTSNEVIISVMSPVGPITGLRAGNPFTSDAIFYGVGWAHLITTSAGTYRGQWDAQASNHHSSTVSFKAAASGSGGPCDLSGDGAVTQTDVTRVVDMTLGTTPCSANITGPGVCTIITVQRVVNAALGQQCVTDSVVSHRVVLNWTASSSSNVSGYNVFRSMTAGGPYTKINASIVTGTSYTDTTVQNGRTYYYVATAVDGSGTSSSYSNQTVAAIPAQ